jgi:hypothetical protein
VPRPPTPADLSTDPFDLSATEVLAWTEGFVTAIPHLPPAPDLGLLAKREAWPTTISAMFGAGKEYVSLPSKPVRDAVLARIGDVVCGSVTTDKRDSLAARLNTILEMTRKKSDPSNRTVTLVKSFFESQTGWLTGILDQIKKCPK